MHCLSPEGVLADAQSGKHEISTTCGVCGARAHYSLHPDTGRTNVTYPRTIEVLEKCDAILHSYLRESNTSGITNFTDKERTLQMRHLVYYRVAAESFPSGYSEKDYSELHNKVRNVLQRLATDYTSCWDDLFPKKTMTLSSISSLENCQIDGYDPKKIISLRYLHYILPYSDPEMINGIFFEMALLKTKTSLACSRFASYDMQAPNNDGVIACDLLSTISRAVTNLSPNFGDTKELVFHQPSSDGTYWREITYSLDKNCIVRERMSALYRNPYQP